MKLGDPKRAGLLGIVALGAIGFMVIQLVPSGASGSGAVATPAEGDPLSLDGTVAPSALMTDPFSHAIQQAKDVADKANARTQEAMDAVREAERGGGSATTGVFGAGGNQPLIPTGPNGATLPAILPGSLPDTVKTAGFYQQFNQADAVEIAVQGFMQMKTPKAFISVGGEAANAYKVGDAIAEGLTLDAIWNDEIVVSRKGISFKVAIGGTRRL